MIYSAFGLGLAVRGAIPRLSGAPAAHRADVRIELNVRPAWFAETLPARVVNESPYDDSAGASMRTLRELANGWLRLSYVDGTDFLVDRPGSQIWVRWPDSLTVDDMSSYLLGPVMGFVLRLRGCVCLHASGIVSYGRAFAMVGPSEAGKSTTAAAFAARGHPVLADDVVPLVDKGDAFEVLPTYPRVRLRPSSLDALAALDATVPTLPSDWGDRRYHLDIKQQGYTFQSHPMPLGAIYLLRPRIDSDEAPRVEPLSGEEGLMALISNSFAATLLDREMRARDFEVMGRLSSHVPLRAVRPHADPKYLSQLCDVILDDFRSIVTSDLIQAQ